MKNKQKIITVVEDVGRKEIRPLALLVRMKNGRTAEENSVVVSQKNKNRIAICSSNSTSAYLYKRIERRVLETYFYTYVHSNIIQNAKTWKQPISIDRLNGILKVGMYRQWNVIQCLKGLKILHWATTLMNLEGVVLSEISQYPKDK